MKSSMTPIEPSSAIRFLGLGIMLGSYFSVKWGLHVVESIMVGSALICFGHFLYWRTKTTAESESCRDDDGAQATSA